MDLRTALQGLRLFQAEFPVERRSTAPLSDDVQRQIARFESDWRVQQLTPDAQIAIHDALAAIRTELASAAIVFAWGALIDTVHEVLWRDQFGQLNQHLALRRKPKTRESVRDVRDADLLDSCRDAGLLNNAMHKILGSMLDERNLAGHVGSRSHFTQDFALGFIERVLVQATSIQNSAYP